MLAARRIAKRYYEYVLEDGSYDVEGNLGNFNVDATPHWVDDEVYEFDTPDEMIRALRRDGVEFAATGRADWASDPDGSRVVDYATGEREIVSWHFFPTMPLGTHLFVIAFVDRRHKRFDYYPSGQIRRVIEALPAHHFMRDAVARARG